MAVVLSLTVLAGQVFLGVPLGLIDAIFQQGLHLPAPHLAREPLMLGAINLIVLSGTVALGLCLNRLPLRQAFPLLRPRAAELAGVALVILGADVLLSELDNLARWIAPPPQWLLDLVREMFFPKGRFFSQFFLLVIVAPVTEEPLFRGIILRGLLSRYRPFTAVALSSFLFAFIHLNPWQCLSAFFLGLAVGWIYLRSGSILLCVLAHAISNGMSLLFATLALEIPGMSGTFDAAHVQFQPWWLDLTGAAILLGGIWLFVRATPALEGATERPGAG